MLRIIVVTLAILMCSTAAADTMPAPAPSEADRAVLTRIVVDTWASHVDADDRDAWLADVAQRAQSVPLAWLEGAAAALDLRTAQLALDGLAPLDEQTPAAFGQAGGDLVFTPTQPCRLLDTRVPSPRSGIIAGDSSRAFYGYRVIFEEEQGGAYSYCGMFAEMKPEALAITLAAVNPSGDGYLTAYPEGNARPLVASLNYTAGSVTSTGLILPINNWAPLEDFVIYSRRDTHVVADVTGYFSRPQAAKLDCTTVLGTSQTLEPGGPTLVHAPVCPMTHTGMFGGCAGGSPDTVLIAALVSSGRTMCSYMNNATTNRNVRADAVCCRTPGRSD